MVMLRALFYTIVRFTAICSLYGGRRTMINTMQTQSIYLTMVLQEGRKGLTKRVHLY